MSSILTLNWRDFLDSVGTAVATAVCGAVFNALQNGGSLTTLNWGAIGSVALLALFGSLVKSLGTAQNGKMFGKI